jgi:aryl-alcohol dehydrogenase-like predicted oxidoreductase
LEQRVLGRTGLRVSALGFGCGAVGGLIARGTANDQERAVARAVDLGINYFDTAAAYGNGESEKNLGRVLELLRPDVFVATKVRVDPARRGSIGKAISQSAETSLRRLRRDRVDAFQLHTPVSLEGGGGALDLRSVIEEIIPAFEALRQAGKVRFYGFSGTGEASTLPRLVDTGAFDVAQILYNVINPSAGGRVKFQAIGPDFGGVLAKAQQQSMGVVGIRVLAGGA